MTDLSSTDFETLLSRIQSPALLVVAQQWNAARGARRMPAWKDLSSTLTPYARLLWGFDYDPELREFTGKLAGQRLSRWIGENFYGGRLEDLHARANYGEAQELLTRVVTTPLAGRSSGCLFKVAGFSVTGERIVLPMAEDGRVGNGILGASDYEPPPLLGPVEMVHENVEWYPI